ncbi:molybdopterin oxidoreductase [Streptomyces spiroverticillatus]|uniref:Molybdopterin oxidoreductase n=1 Tax=Streptomyces finlayi TaxID=67296 RepID=A0A919CAB3_9ACTN|nr:molybdopterin oxidoreductase family protein [Streptomyces finlayi]GHA11471.1 molybdopterin oxidoreductase [Streptomyces spiroverticillatus]GHC94985.1 molybdopterin oxidoreductase [Streptomyces finlayi]
MASTSRTPGPALKLLPGACPLDCPDGCSWQVEVDEEGTAVALRGTPDHPYTRGTLCVKVNQYLEHTRAPDRLLHPMRRVGRKGEGRFERIGWDEALDEIAGRLAGVVEQYGGEAVWPYQGTGNLGYIQGLQGRAGSRLWNSIGASRHDMTICSVAGLVGTAYALGTSRGMDPEDLRHSKLILLWGGNTLTTSHHLWKVVGEAQRAGAHVVVIDPVRTRTARLADEHLPLRPGTDAALVLGLLHVVVAMGAEDRAYLEQHTRGWPEFKERIATFTPERTAEITGLPVADIVRLGERLATTRPTGMKAAQGIQRHAGGGMALRTLACLPGVTGDWKLPGGGLAYSTDGYFGGDREALYRDDLLTRPVRALSMTRLGEALTTVKDPPVKALIVYGANPAAAVGGQETIRSGLAREDLFTVVMEHFHTDTVDYADIVLPATMQTEHADLHDGYGHMYISWNEPAVRPPGECLSTTETFRRLAARLGLEEPSLYASDDELARDLLSGGHPSLDGIDLERLRRDGWARLNYPSPFVPFSDGFPTASGKLEFVSDAAEADGHDRLAGYTPAQEVTDPELARRFPLVLISSASHFFLNTTFGNKESLMRRAGGPTVELHADDAAARGLTEGQQVRIFNDRGAFEAKLSVTDSVRPGIARTTKGHWSRLTGGAPGVNATVAERDADMGGGAVYQDNRVEVSGLR